MKWAASLVGLALAAGCTEGDPFVIAGIPTRNNPVCTVTDVIDGDSIKMFCRGTDQRSVRLTGYDTPETFQPGCTAELRLGQRATAYLETQLRAAREIWIEPEGNDKYDRVLIRMRLDGRELSDIMIAEGVAVAYSGGRRINWCERLAQT